MYVVVRTDLSPNYRAVQATHAALAAKDLIDDSPHPSLVVLGVPNEEELLARSRRLREFGIAHSLFFEDDVESHTALATRNVRAKAERKEFADLKCI